jgi:membrane associated rhomboid family serine protease
MSNYGRMGGLGKFGLFPPVLKSLIIINLVIFVFQHWLFGPFTISGVSISHYMVKYLGLIPWNTSDVLSLGMNTTNPVFYPWQLVSYQFLHGGLWHVLFNLFALWMFGAELENRWGSAKFLAYYLLAGIGAGLIHLIVSPLIGPTAPTVGASGSIYGILLAFAVTYPDRPIYMFPFFIPIPAKFFMIIFAVIELVLGVSGSDGVAHFAHLGGALVGYLLLKFGDDLGIFQFAEKVYSSGNKGNQSGFNMGSTYEPPKQSKGDARVFRMEWKSAKKEQEQQQERTTQTETGRRFEIDGELITQERIDRILDKISESGYQNLTDKEKYILTELSKKL